MNHSYNYFHIKMTLKFLVKSLPYSAFFTDHLKHKTVNKTGCTMLSANLRQLYAHYHNCFDNFLRLLGFSKLFAKVFLITFKFS